VNPSKSTQGIHMYKYIGIDISKATLDVYDGLRSYKFTNDTKGFKSIIKLAKEQQHIPKNKLCLIFEPTGVYAYDLMRYCQAHKIKAIIVGSKVARDYAKSIKQRSKTDKIDAKVLYRYHTQVDPGSITIPMLDDQILKLSQHRNIYEKYQETIGRFRNLIESVNKNDKALMRSLERQINALQKECLRLLTEIEKIICSIDKNAMHLINLQTIPGIGKKSALHLLIEIIRYKDTTAKEMTALMGLDPVLRDSGTFKGKSRISKQGGKSLRTKLYLPTVVAIQYNEHLKVFYERLVSNGKPKKLAILAAMRKLLIMALAIVRNKEVYRAPC